MIEYRCKSGRVWMKRSRVVMKLDREGGHRKSWYGMSWCGMVNTAQMVLWINVG